jgi:hypothetical protein
VEWQWLDEQAWSFAPDGTIQASTQVATITYVASLEGVPIYVKWNGSVPYLCADITADLWITAGAFKIQIKADASPATGGTKVYFKDSAAIHVRLYSALATGLNCHIPSSNPDFRLVVVYNATPEGQGVELRYDNVTHNRLEAVNAGGVNASIDLSASMGLNSKVLPNSMGTISMQGAFGDAKMTAGGFWASATAAGSRARQLYTVTTGSGAYRWGGGSTTASREICEPV